MWKDRAKYSGGTSPGESRISHMLFLGNSAPVAFTLEKAADFWPCKKKKNATSIFLFQFSSPTPFGLFKKLDS